MRIHGLILALVTVLLGPVWAAADDEPVTVSSLLGKMVDLRWLVVPPAVGERTVQFSSYDRASKLVDGKLVEPFANGDRGHYQRVDTRADGSKEFVLAETDGPGYVSRIWSANPAGILRIYVDGSDTPALEADFEALTHGKVPPFSPPFGHEASRGCNLYFPFPFAKSIKIVTSEGDQYFQVGVTYLPKGTAVESYSAQVLKDVEAYLPNYVAPLTTEVPLRKFLAGLPDIGPAVEIGPGETALLSEGGSKGNENRAISGMRLKVEAPQRDLALARSLLTIQFDDAAEPQVAVPVGDFFGSGPGLNPYSSFISEVREDGTMMTDWLMPFSHSYRIRLTNGSDEPIKVTIALAYTGSLPAGDLLRFHARWKLEDDLQTVEADGTREWDALGVKGTPGRFVGLMLNVFNPTSAWWGEGDEKVYVDGEAFPSTFGTGTEDYFGYAWCDPHLYVNPFHAQTRCDGPANKGNTSNVRYQILDQIPWQESLDFDMEVWHWQAVKMQYATIAYFYTAPGAAIDPSADVDLSTRMIHTASTKVFREPGVIEAESLKVQEATAGDAPNQDMEIFGEQWSAGGQLWWVVREPQGTLTLTLPVAEAGTYDISGAFTRAGDYGTFQLALDGKALGEPLDLYHDGVTHSGSVPLGRVTLEPGEHTLSVTIQGKNAASTSYLFGMDWIKLEPR